MIKLTDLFEDITVRPARMVIFKIPATLTVDRDHDNNSDIYYTDGVSIPSQALLPDLNLYAKYPILNFSEVVVEIQEDTKEVYDVRCVFCVPSFSEGPYKDLPDGFDFDPVVYDLTGFYYVSFKGVGNIKLDDVEELVNIPPYEERSLKTIQDAANYLLFKSN